MNLFSASKSPQQQNIQASQKIKSLPLGLILVLPFVLQIISAVGLVGYLSFKNGRQSVAELANRLESEIANRVNRETIGFLETPHLVNQVLLQSVYSGNLNLEDKPALEKFFFTQIKNHGIVPYLFYVDNLSNFLGVQKLDNGQFVGKIKDKSTGKNRNVYQLDSQGDRTKLIKSTEFDSREYFVYEQPSNIKATKKEQPTWSKVSLSSKKCKLSYPCIVKPID